MAVKIRWTHVMTAKMGFNEGGSVLRSATTDGALGETAKQIDD